MYDIPRGFSSAMAADGINGINANSRQQARPRIALLDFRMGDRGEGYGLTDKMKTAGTLAGGFRSVKL
jgi:hypothetical protein